MNEGREIRKIREASIISWALLSDLRHVSYLWPSSVEHQKKLVQQMKVMIVGMCGYLRPIGYNRSAKWPRIFEGKPNTFLRILHTTFIPASIIVKTHTIIL